MTSVHSKLAKRMILLAVGALLFTATKVSAQVIVADTIPITVVQGVLASVQAADVTGPFHVGDSIVFHAQAYDADMDPVDAVYTWGQETVDDAGNTVTAALQLDQTRCTAQSCYGTFTRKLQQGEAIHVIVQAQQVDQLTMGWFRPSDGAAAINFTDPLEFNAIGDGAQLCAYLLYRGKLVAQNSGSPGYPNCPYSFGGPPMDNQANGIPMSPGSWYQRSLGDLMRGLVNLSSSWVSTN